MGVKLKNNAESTLASAISAGDLSLSVAYGDGPLFATLGGGDYFYMTIEASSGAYEIVKVTARVGDAMTIVRAQEGTSALAFSSGALCEQRITAQTIVDLIAESAVTNNSISYAEIQDISATQRVLGRNTAGAGDPEEVTATQLLDWLGSTRGQILYRGASGWTVLAPGTIGNLLQTGGAGSDPSWVAGFSLSDGDKGDITVSASGATWTIDNDAVSYAKFQNVSAQYRLLGRSSSGAGDVQEITSSADIFTFLGSADKSAARTALDLGTLALQAASAVNITGGTASGITSLQARSTISSETANPYTVLSANAIVNMSGAPGTHTINGSVFSPGDIILFYSGDTARTLTQGSGLTMRLGGGSTTGNRSLAVRTMAVCYFVSGTECVVSGQGVT